MFFFIGNIENNKISRKMYVNEPLNFNTGLHIFAVWWIRGKKQQTIKKHVCEWTAKSQHASS